MLRILMLASVAFAASWVPASAEGEVIFRYKSGLVTGAPCEAPCITPGPGDDDDEGGWDPDGETVVDGIVIDNENEHQASPTALALTPTTFSFSPDHRQLVYQCFEASGGHGNYVFDIGDEVFTSGGQAWVEDMDVVRRAALGSAFPSKHPVTFDWGSVNVLPGVAGTDLITSDQNDACIRFKVDTAVTDKGTAQVFFAVTDHADEVVVAGNVPFDDWGAYSYVSFRVNVTPTEPPCSDNCQVATELEIAGPNFYLNPGRNLFPFTATGGSGGYTWEVLSGGTYLAAGPGPHKLEVEGSGPWSVTVSVRDSDGTVAIMSHTFEDGQGPTPPCNYDYWDEIIDCEMQ